MSEENNVPNLDAMPEHELSAFWAKYHRPRRQEAQDLIGGWRKGYISIVEDLANYAINKSVAMACRRQGKIDTALIYETICEGIYGRLPLDLRW